MTVTEVRDQVFSTVGGINRLADLYLPRLPEAEAAPVIVWVHGGGWRHGDRRMAPDLSRFFAQRGFAMVSLDYRLSGEAIFPAAVEDVKTCVRWVRSVAARFGLDAGKIGLWGSSAGAHLAACAALTGDDRFVTSEHTAFSSAVQAVVDGYGPTDFARIDADRIPAGSAPVDVEGITVSNLLPAADPESFESRFLGTPVRADSAEVALANPAGMARAGAPPFLILHGRYDPLIPWQQSLLLFDALSAAGNDATLLVLERLGHGFFNRSDLDSVNPGAIARYRSPVALDDGVETAPFGFDMVERFFRARLR